MYLCGNKVDYAGVCLRSVMDESKGTDHELCNATRGLKPLSRTRAINKFFRLYWDEDVADPAIQRVRLKRRKSGKPDSGLPYIRAVMIEIRREIGLE